MRAFTMRTPAFRTVLRRIPLHYLLWLALLLPVAQVAASWHELSHLARDSAATGQDRSALHLGHCELCLNAAAVHIAGLPSTPVVWAGPAQQHALPSGPVVASPDTPLSLAYRSRAPPFTPV
jgi:hypothetical protein